MTKLTVDIECHVSGVAASTVSDETSVRPNILVAESHNFKNTRRRTRRDLHSLVLGGQSSTVHAPLYGGFGEAVEGTGDGCRGTVEEVKVRGEHGVLGSSWSERRWFVCE